MNSTGEVQIRKKYTTDKTTAVKEASLFNETVPLVLAKIIFCSSSRPGINKTQAEIRTISGKNPTKFLKNNHFECAIILITAKS